MVILRLERLAALALPAGVVTDLIKGDHRVSKTGKTNRVAATDEVKAIKELGIVELFLKCQGGTRETGDKDDGRLGGVAGSMGPDLGPVL